MADHRVRLDDERWDKLNALWRADLEAASPSDVVAKLIDKAADRRKQ